MNALVNRVSKIEVPPDATDGAGAGGAAGDAASPAAGGDDAGATPAPAAKKLG